MLDSVRDYYEEKLSAFGPTPRGVDWNGNESQFTRFEALSSLLPGVITSEFSLDDYGCGYGAFAKHLHASGFTHVDYLGIDVSSAMVAEASKANPDQRFVVGKQSPRVADYAVASGIFNVALDADRTTWQEYVLRTLDEINAATLRGFAFNCLTAYSDKDKMRPHLYYGDPCFFLQHCMMNYSTQAALLHDYGLYEFTILVKKIS
jgi:SAM-dependent methyltransferase